MPPRAAATLWRDWPARLTRIVAPRLLDDPHNLDGFLRAQAGAYAQALGELRRGHKTGHWIWFIFPQIAGLGSSPTSRLYAIVSLDEARAYATHPVLGQRL